MNEVWNHVVSGKKNQVTPAKKVLKLVEMLSWWDGGGNGHVLACPQQSQMQNAK